VTADWYRYLRGLPEQAMPRRMGRVPGECQHQPSNVKNETFSGRPSARPLFATHHPSPLVLFKQKPNNPRPSPYDTRIRAPHARRRAHRGQRARRRRRLTNVPGVITARGSSARSSRLLRLRLFRPLLGTLPPFTASAPATQGHKYPRAIRPPPPAPPTAHAAAATSRPSWRAGSHQA